MCFLIKLVLLYSNYCVFPFLLTILCDKSQLNTVIFFVPFLTPLDNVAPSMEQCDGGDYRQGLQDLGKTC